MPSLLCSYVADVTTAAPPRIVSMGGHNLNIAWLIGYCREDRLGSRLYYSPGGICHGVASEIRGGYEALSSRDREEDSRWLRQGARDKSPPR